MQSYSNNPFDLMKPAVNVEQFCIAIRRFYRVVSFDFTRHMKGQSVNDYFGADNSSHQNQGYYKIEDLMNMFHDFIETTYQGESGISYNGVKMVK